MELAIHLCAWVATILLFNAFSSRVLAIHLCAWVATTAVMTDIRTMTLAIHLCAWVATRYAFFTHAFHFLAIHLCAWVATSVLVPLFIYSYACNTSVRMGCNCKLHKCRVYTDLKCVQFIPYRVLYPFKIRIYFSIYGRQAARKMLKMMFTSHSHFCFFQF